MTGRFMRYLLSANENMFRM